MSAIITDTPIKTCKYRNHPNPAIQSFNNKGKSEWRCSKCNRNITHNWCKCSPQQYLIHQDREKNSYVLRGILSGTKFTERFIRSFELEKGCTPYEVGKYLNLAEIGWEKGITDCDHRMSPIGFDLTNPQHLDFIRHIKNLILLSSKKNKQKSSHNDPDEIKIAYEEFAKQTPPGDIHDILNARRKRGGAKEVPHIVEEIIPDMTRSEEPSEWNEHEAEIAKANAKREAEIAKANAKYEAEIVKANAKYEANKIQKEISKHQSEILKHQSEISKYQSLIDALRKKQQDI